MYSIYPSKIKNILILTHDIEQRRPTPRCYVGRHIGCYAVKRASIQLPINSLYPQIAIAHKSPRRIRNSLAVHLPFEHDVMTIADVAFESDVIAFGDVSLTFWIWVEVEVVLRAGFLGVNDHWNQ